MDFPRQFFNEKIRRFGLFVSRNDIKSAASTVTPLDSSCANIEVEEDSSKETRIEEGYTVSLIPFENNLLSIVFNKKNYCLTDKVIIEVWDPDNTLRDSEKVMKVISTVDQIGIKLKKLIKYPSFYRGEMRLSENESVDGIQLRVNKTDTITARINEQIQQKAFVSSEDSFIYNQRQNIDNFFEYHCREFKNCDDQLSKSLFTKDNKDVLIAIVKKNYQPKKGEEGKADYNVFLDKEESLLCRKIIYNNQMLYDLSANEATCNLDKTIFISKTETCSIDEIQPGRYKVMEPIRIIEKGDRFANEELEFPPHIYLGRVSSGNKTRDSILYNEDICFNSQGKIVIAGESFDPSSDTEKDLFENMKKEINLIFKPIDIRSKEKSFRILLAKRSKSSEQGSNGEKLANQNPESDSSAMSSEEKDGKITLRWWAICKFKGLD